MISHLWNKTIISKEKAWSLVAMIPFDMNWASRGTCFITKHKSDMRKVEETFEIRKKVWLHIFIC